MSAGGLKLLACGLLFLTTACGPVVPASPPPPPQVVKVAFPPSLKLVDEALNSCALANPGIALLVSELPFSDLVEAEADLILWLGEPPENAGFSAPLASEEIVFIVHPDNPVRAFSAKEVTSLLSGDIQNWEQLVEMDEQVTVWAYPPGNEVQQVVLDEFMQLGSITSAGFVAPDPLAMVEAISADPGGIGFLPGAWLTGDVTSVEVAREEGVDLRRPVLAVAENHPDGNVRTLLACLQSPTGQNVLDRRYEPWIE